MNGTVLNTGSTPYQLFCGDRGYTVGASEKIELPIWKCIELIRNGVFTPDKETYKKLNLNKLNYEKYECMLEGQRCFILGSGSSIKDFSFSKLDNFFTIAVNHTLEFYPNAKACIFLDRRFYERFPQNKILLRNYNGFIFCATRTFYNEIDNRDNVVTIPTNAHGPSDKLYKGLYSTWLSGLAAINLALIMKAKEIYLLGFDMDYTSENHHFYGNEYHKGKYHEDRTQEKLKQFDKLKHYDNIYNCNKESKIKVFQYRSIDDILCDTGQVRQ